MERIRGSDSSTASVCTLLRNGKLGIDGIRLANVFGAKSWQEALEESRPQLLPLRFIVGIHWTIRHQRQRYGKLPGFAAAARINVAAHLVGPGLDEMKRDPA